MEYVLSLIFLEFQVWKKPTEQDFDWQEIKSTLLEVLGEGIVAVC